jgi:hypothetical protein
MQAEMKAHVEKTPCEQDAIMKKFREVENKVEEAAKMTELSTIQKWKLSGISI